MLGCLVGLGGSVTTRSIELWAEEVTPPDTVAADIFAERIMPIFRSDKPSSCVQCHLSSVDLKDYIRPSHRETFIALRDQGLIDIEQPTESKILTLIQMGERDLDKGAQLIHAEMRDAEYAAFAEWIIASAADPELRAAKPADDSQSIGPAKPDAVIRHARKSRVMDSFVRHVWSQRMRCFPCHTPHEIDPDNPQHRGAVKTQEKFAEQFDEPMLDRLHFFRETPEATLDFLLERSRQVTDGELPLVNLEQPAKSLIVLKPLSKLPARSAAGEFEPPSYREPVSHMGGMKMHPDDPSYKAFIAWVSDYAKVTGDQYVSAADLPADNWIPTQKVVRLADVPAAVPNLSTLQLMIHDWDESANDWSAEPIAFTQNKVNPRRMVVAALFILAPEDQAADDGELTEKLAGGRYLVKLYADLENRLAEHPTMLLGDDDYLGSIELDQPEWVDGFRNMVKISASELVSP